MPHGASSRGADESRVLEVGFQAGRAGNHAEAVRLMMPLAEQGNIVAMEAVGFSLVTLGDLESGYTWLRRCADVGVVKAAADLGLRALALDTVADSDGLSIGPGADTRTALRLLPLAAENGDTLAAVMLAHTSLTLGDFDSAIHWWTDVVARNDPAYPELVEESRMNIAELQSDSAYVSHILKRRLGES